MKANELGVLQLDGLREVANIGAGHAATALSQLTSRRIMIDVPEVQFVNVEDVSELTGDPSEAVGAVAMQVFGDAKARTVIILPAATAQRVTEILLRTEGLHFPDAFGEMERSALKEVGNMLAGAYLTALSDFLGMLLLPSVPELALDMAGAVLQSTHLDFTDTESVLCIETCLRMDGQDNLLRGYFLMLPAAGSLERILQAIRLA